MNYRIKTAEFIAGAFKVQQLPDVTVPEIAFVGRSNVGKSTLVNRLTGRKKLARVSNTPGRTQQLNIFSIDLLDPNDRSYQFSLVDLPGYGYAKFSKARRQVMSQMIVEYIHQRPQLAVVCLLNDSKRLPEEDEIAIRDLCFSAGVGLIVCPTKCDRLKRNELEKKLTAIANAYGLQKSDLLPTGEKSQPQQFWQRALPLLYA